jgi:hypothetical protein
MRYLVVPFVLVTAVLLTGCDPDSPLLEGLYEPFMNDIYPSLVRAYAV